MTFSRGLLATLAVAALGGLASPAAAVDFAIEARGGYADFTHAAKSTEAVFDSRGAATYGGGVRADLGEDWFVRLSATYLKKSGERVFVADADSPVFRLGHPLEMSLLPVYLDFTRRFPLGRAFHSYVGLGVGSAMFKETSTVAGEEFKEDRSQFSARAILGVNFGTGKFKLGAEGAYARTRDAVGLGGVSKVYDENDLGGLSGLATLTWWP